MGQEGERRECQRAKKERATKRNTEEEQDSSSSTCRASRKDRRMTWQSRGWKFGLSASPSA
eukprot:749884-Hanusia_phi.AAC.5